MGLARAAARLMKGRSADGVRAAGKAAVEDLIDLVQPWAIDCLAAHRADGRLLVLATTSPHDLVDPLAEALGFDDVIATRYQEVDGRYTGRLVGKFMWGRGKRDAAREWAADHGIDLTDCHAYSDSFFDVPLLGAVGHPHPLNADPRLAAVAIARRWPLENWDRPPGVPSVVGLEPYHLIRPFVRPESFPYARFSVNGIEHIPAEGAVILVVQPPQLLRRGRTGHRGRPAQPSRAVHGQTGAVRRTGRRPAVAGAGRHSCRPGEWFGGSHGPGHRRPAGRRGRHRPPPGHHPPGREVLRHGPPRARPARPAWPPTPVPRSSRSGCGGPRRCGPGRPRSRTSPTSVTHPG